MFLFLIKFFSFDGANSSFEINIRVIETPEFICLFSFLSSLFVDNSEGTDVFNFLLGFHLSKSLNKNSKI